MGCWSDIPGLFTLESNHLLSDVNGDAGSIEVGSVLG